MRGYEYVNATSVKSALEHLQPPDQLPEARRADDWPVRVKSAGLDLLDEWKEGLIAPDRVVSLAATPKLDAVRAGAEGISVGPLCTLSQLAGANALRGPYAAIAQAAGAAATPAIRRRATAGGNLCQRPRCWYYRRADFPCLRKGGQTCYAQSGDSRFHAIFDTGSCVIVHPSSLAVALQALDAEVTLSSRTGTRTLSLDKFFVTPGTDLRRENVLRSDEVLSAIRVPPAAAGTRSAYAKIRHKQSFDWALVELAVALRIAGGTVRDARVVLGAVAPVPWRARAAEQALQGQPASAATFAKAAKLAVKVAKPLDHNHYKVTQAEVLLRRTLEQVAKEGGAA